MRDIVASLNSAATGACPTGKERQRVVKRVRAAGNAAIPALLRGFKSTVENEARWAAYLLGRLGGERVASAIASLVRAQGGERISDEVKVRALGLLSDLRVAPPLEVALRDPEAMLARSVRELLDGLVSERDVEQAVELIAEQVPEPELVPFGAELLRHGGRPAERLLDGILARGGHSAETARRLESMRAQVEHARPARELREALERGLEYLEVGKPRAARKKLERFVLAHPEHAEGRSALGVCLLQLGLTQRAQQHLREAARFEPDEALHRWNLAAAAKQADRMGGCYLALRDYLQRDDQSEGARDRRDEASSFVRTYEKMLRDAHPGVPLRDVLHGEELFARAYAALADGRPDEALRGFEHVLELVPCHYPSWGNLGAAYLALERPDEARRCLQRALELNPDYGIARENLARLHDPRLSPAR